MSHEKIVTCYLTHRSSDELFAAAMQAIHAAVKTEKISWKDALFLDSVKIKLEQGTRIHDQEIVKMNQCLTIINHPFPLLPLVTSNDQLAARSNSTVKQEK